MTKANKVGILISISIITIAFMVVSLCFGLWVGSHLPKADTEAQIGERDKHCENCDGYCDHEHCCEHRHDGCDHDDCDCEDHLAQVLLATGTYYTNNGSFYTLTSSSSTTHYHCTNSSHSGSNDYTSSSVSGTCYTTYPRAGYSTQYDGHSCYESAYGSHSVSTSSRNRR